MAKPQEHTSPDKLSIIVFSGDFDKVHYALVMASAAAAVSKPVTLFFTMDAARAVMKADGDGGPSWRSLPTSSTFETGGDMDDTFRATGTATFEELLSACVELGVTFMVCEMGLKAFGIKHEDLRDDIPFSLGGVVTFLNDASDRGATYFV
ncbi:DsrE/DsrF/DrsH-like family protein [Magnetovibrio sp. PR-2]|uniref:DsrE/DsrF/DrsH-like family protein n=1 Tax=Magnetovibrio sp. PR-2 TaxID=3120356 RepID=UPI002FCE13B9